MLKKCTPLWREAHFQVKMYKAQQIRSTFWSWDVEKGREAHFQVKSVKSWRARTTFRRSDVVSQGRRKGLCTLSKMRKTWGFWSSFRNDGRCGTLEKWRSIRDMFIRDVRRPGRWFHRGCILEHQIFRCAKTILRDRCNTSYDVASLFRGGHNTLDTWTEKIAKRTGTRPSALHSTFHFWRKSRRIASFLIWHLEIEEVSQNCFVFDVVKFKNWRCLADLPRFSCCQVQKLRRSRRMASFSSLQIDR